MGMTVSPILECAQGTGKAGENGQHSGEMGGSSPWTGPSAPRCGDTLKAPARFGSIRVRNVLDDGSGVAIDWVTRRSFSSTEKATRRLNVQSGLRKGWVVASDTSWFERSLP